MGACPRACDCVRGGHANAPCSISVCLFGWRDVLPWWYRCFTVGPLGRLSVRASFHHREGMGAGGAWKRKEPILSEALDVPDTNLWEAPLCLKQAQSQRVSASKPSFSGASMAKLLLRTYGVHRTRRLCTRPVFRFTTPNPHIFLNRVVTDTRGRVATRPSRRSATGK